MANNAIAVTLSNVNLLRYLTLLSVKITIPSINGTFSQLVSSIGGVSLLGMGSILVINNELSIGQRLAFNSMQGNVLALIGSLIGLTDDYFRSQTATLRQKRLEMPKSPSHVSLIMLTFVVPVSTFIMQAELNY